MDNYKYTNILNRGGYTKKQGSSETQKSKKKMDFNRLKKNTVNSLNEVECFLRDFKKFSKYIKLYKVLK